MTQPAQRAFHNPTFRQDLESFDRIVAFDDVENLSQSLFYPVEQGPAIRTIRPHFAETRKPPREFVENRLGPIAILNIRGMDDHDQE